MNSNNDIISINVMMWNNNNPIKVFNQFNLFDLILVAIMDMDLETLGN